MSEKTYGCLIWKREAGKIKYFLVKPTMSKAGYGIPKGHPNEDESPEETAKRETFEETGLIFRDSIKFLASVIYTNGKIVNCYLTKYIDGEFKCNSFFEKDGKKIPEVTGGKFFSYEEGLKVMQPSQQKLLIEANKFFTKDKERAKAPFPFKRSN